MLDSDYDLTIKFWIKNETCCYNKLVKYLKIKSINTNDKNKYQNKAIRSYMNII